MERSDWLIQKLGGWSKSPPQKAFKGLYWQTRGTVIGWIKMTSSLLVYIYIYIYSGVRRFFFKKDGDRQVCLADQRDARC